ncbi:hypothetical protein B0A48_08780 [Cryoendolithus antarcticus]|uniref:Uncharacterized protein n=1 Tax=Cryoendolithus antarcticus TaxID=1507870 RepID=A0A1V8T4V3_9PEZI|nr:hypothetical protein B0A48_08780 [Cryoendolithus antarcticus]
MSDAIHPTAPSQPTLNQAYTTPGNPAQTDPSEKSQASINAKNSTNGSENAVPRTQSTSSDSATPSSLGYGIHGAPPGEEAKGETEESIGRNRELDADQMGAPGEGKVASSVDRKPGASGTQEGLESGLDRKKAEQKAAREEIEGEKKEGLDVGGILGQRGGPASTTS